MLVNSTDIGYKSRMPKPLLPKVVIVRMTDAMLDAIDRIAGKGKRAEFVRQAVEAKLRQAERERREGKNSK